MDVDSILAMYEDRGSSRYDEEVTVDSILAMYEDRGSSRYDEEVTQTEHALQCAALAERASVSDALTAAALLHDIGHLLEGDGAPAGAQQRDEDRRHEALAARCLEPLFGPAVSGPVALHVAAKRYLCSVDPAYHATLSPASVRSFVLQGGPLDAGQVEAFEGHRGSADAVELRRWDDLAKVRDAETRDLADYRGLLVDLAEVRDAETRDSADYRGLLIDLARR